MRSGSGRGFFLPFLFFIACTAILLVSRQHISGLPRVGRDAKSQTPDGMDASTEKAALAQVAESADMTYPLFDYTYDKIATLSSERRRSKDPCVDVLLPNGGTSARSGAGLLALVTGGAGFIGSNLVDRLLSLGYKVRIYDNLYTGFLRNVPLGHPDVEFILGDILNHTSLQRAMEGVDYVYHLAAMSKVVPSLKDPDMARFCTEANALGSWNVLDAVRRQGNIKKVVYAASSTFYGNRQPPHSEDMAPDFLTPYAASKFEGEIQMQMFDRLFDVPTISTRFFMVYGPRQPSTGAYAIVTGIFAKQAAEGRPLTIEGDGTHYRDFIHVRDIIEGMIVAQQIVDLRGDVVNLGSGRAFSVNDVANLISSSQVNVDPRPNDLEGTLADTCKMKRLLNYRAQADFKTEMAYMAKETMLGNVFMQSWLQPFHALSAPHLLAPGSPVFNWPNDPTDLDALLLTLKHIQLSILPDVPADNARISVIVFTSAAESAEDRGDALLNTVFSLVRFGEVLQYLVAAVDDDALKTCLSLNLPCYDARTQTAPGLLLSLTSRGHDIHLSRYGNSYIAPTMRWITSLIGSQGDADVFGATPSGDLFVTANDRTRAALQAWPEPQRLVLSDLRAVTMLYAVNKWPRLEDLTIKTYDVQRLCPTASSGRIKSNSYDHGQSTLQRPYPPHSANADADLPSNEPAHYQADDGAQTHQPKHDYEPQTLAEAEALEQSAAAAEAEADAAAAADADRSRSGRSGSRHRPRRDAASGDSEAGAEAAAKAEAAANATDALCARAFYQAVGCTATGPPPAAASLRAALRAAGAWHLAACPDPVHCDRQQVVPLRWVQPTPDLMAIGGIC